MSAKHILGIVAGVTAVATVVNFAVTNTTALNKSNLVCSLNAYLQYANPLYYAKVVVPPAIPAT